MKTETNNFIGTMIELHICADPIYLSVARSVVRNVAEISGVKKSETEQITLALVEALTNVIRHGYGGPCEKQIFISFSKIKCPDGKIALEILIRDFGKQVEPEIIEAHQLDVDEPGGLGVHIIQSVMDQSEFTKADDRGMLLRMVKYIE